MKSTYKYHFDRARSLKLSELNLSLYFYTLQLGKKKKRVTQFFHRCFCNRLKLPPHLCDRWNTSYLFIFSNLFLFQSTSTIYYILMFSRMSSTIKLYKSYENKILRILGVKKVAHVFFLCGYTDACM